MFAIANQRESRAEQLVRMRRELDALEAEWVRLVGEFDRAGACVAEGSLTTASWLRHACRLTHAAAERVVRLARRLKSLPETEVAFAAGDVSITHAHVIADAATDARREAIIELEAPIVDAAKVSTPRELRQIVQRVTDALDGDKGASGANERYDRRRLHVSRLLDGMVKVDGLLDTEGGEMLLKALDDADPLPRNSDDHRSRAQRRADTLVELVEVGTVHRAHGPGRKTVPRLAGHLSYGLLEERGGPALGEQLRSDLEHLGHVATATLERIACDCSIARVITRGRSEPLDVGRSTRVVPTGLWNALVARDGGCVEKQCDRPPGWCDVHHVISWWNGGETSLANTELRCRRHHRAVHEGGHDPPI